MTYFGNDTAEFVAMIQISGCDGDGRRRLQSSGMTIDIAMPLGEVRHRLCRVFPLPRLCRMFPLPSWLRHRLCLVCFHCPRG